MRTEFPELMEMDFFGCRNVSPTRFGEQAIERFIEMGGHFVSEMGLDPHPSPYTFIQADGIVSGDIRHPLLTAGEKTHWEIENLGKEAVQRPLAHFFAWPAFQVISLMQKAVRTRLKVVDRVALGLLRLAMELYPRFRPRFGSIDEMAWGKARAERTIAGPPPMLYWANFFGPELVESLGREFLLQSPCWRVVELDDGGVLLVASESYLSWWKNDLVPLEKYLRQRAPDLRIFRGEPIRDW